MREGGGDDSASTKTFLKVVLACVPNRHPDPDLTSTIQWLYALRGYSLQKPRYPETILSISSIYPARLGSAITGREPAAELAGEGPSAPSKASSGSAMEQASTAAVLACGLGLDPAAAPVEVLLNPLKTATGSIGGTAAWQRAPGPRTCTRSPQRPARRAQGHPLGSTGAPVAARTPKRACGGALVPTQHRPLTAQSLQPPMRE